MTEHTRAALTKDGPPFWSIKERRQLLRELIMHEDNLTNERTRALYTLQGFLFASFGLFARGLFAGTTASLPMPARAIITIIAAVGIISARFYWQELHMGTAAITQILRDWNELGRLFPGTSYPRIMGFVAKEEQRLGGPNWLPRRTVPTLCMIVWFAAAFAAWL